MYDLKALASSHMTAADAARRLGLTKMAVSKRIANGRLPALAISHVGSGYRTYAVPAWAVELELAARELAALREKSAN